MISFRWNVHHHKQWATKKKVSIAESYDHHYFMSVIFLWHCLASQILFCSTSFWCVKINRKEQTEKKRGKKVRKNGFYFCYSFDTSCLWHLKLASKWIKRFLRKQQKLLIQFNTICFDCCCCCCCWVEDTEPKHRCWIINFYLFSNFVQHKSDECQIFVFQYFFPFIEAMQQKNERKTWLEYKKIKI